MEGIGYMPDKTEITATVFKAVDEVNELRGRDEQIGKELSTRLLGGDSALDSLGVVNLLVALEGKLSEDLGRSVSVTEDEALLEPGGPLSTIETLVDYLVEKLG
jgi:acyl carrier protein